MQVRHSRLALLTIGLGLANAVALIGWRPLDPTNVAWIFGDNATYYTGWALFRHDSHIRFPLAWTDRVGYPVGTSIAFLDAMPLLAVLLRPLGPILPEPFQYLGPYAALCFALQAYFGYSLCRRLFPSEPAFTVLGSLFFLLSPTLTQRAFGHTTLLTHWAILAGLDGYFRDPGETPVRWLGRQWIIVAIAAGITPYIAFMCLLVALAAVARLMIERRCGLHTIALLVAITMGIVLASGAVFGVLLSHDAATYLAGGYGLFSMNLNAPVNPMDLGSMLLPPLPLMHPWQYEGYNYLGLGMIALLVVGLVRRPQSILWLRERRLLPLVGLGLVCTALAASTTISFGSSVIFKVHGQPAIPMPDQRVSEASMGMPAIAGKAASAIVTVLHGLRASGRLFWPAYYLMFIAALSLTFRAWKASTRVLILAVLLVVQFADMTPMRTRVHAAMTDRFESPLQSPSWKGLGRRYDNLILVPSFQCDQSTFGVGGRYGFVWFGKLAAAERMRANSYYAARYTNAQLRAHCLDLMRAHLDGTLDPRSAYVVTDDVLTIWALRGVRSARCEKADGFNLCTPSPEGGAAPLAVPPAPPYAVGDVLDLTGPADVRRYLTFGWGRPNRTGTWTFGPLALIRLGLAPDTRGARPLLLEVNALTFVDPSHPRLDVDVVANGEPVDHWIVGSPAAPLRARIPPRVLAGRDALDIEFRLRNPEFPADPRLPSNVLLGLEVVSLAVTYGE